MMRSELLAKTCTVRCHHSSLQVTVKILRNESAQFMLRIRRRDNFRWSFHTPDSVVTLTLNDSKRPIQPHIHVPPPGRNAKPARKARSSSVYTCPKKRMYL